jgi:predicted helicase
MSIQLIQQYYAKVEQMIRYGGTRNESTLRKPFQDLLEAYARSKNLVLVPEVEFTTRSGHKVYPDGTLKDALRQAWGFWESKDEKDDLEAEIEVKFAKGYPTFNILFEDTHTGVLYQGGVEVLRASFMDAPALDRLLTLFISYEPAEVREFHKAIELFSTDVQGLADTLRMVIDEQFAVNEAFRTALQEFLELCRQAINPKVEMADMREMVIQHVLTEDIFMRVFDEADFHRDNVIAHKLQEVAGTFYKGDTKRNIHAKIAPYYETINAKASQISDHHEKQKFLKALYESFYRAYNPKAADRLGVIYTPDEIVRFMIESADHLVFEHFGKTLGEKGVEILDPATGTGTFITELIEYLPLNQLEYKYRNEIHCNELAILPYYIANLNIEYTYKQKTGKYLEFENICFVDTLDNMGFTSGARPQLNFFNVVDENAFRIGQQNQRKISVIIGNPPYNANQLNENENNKNREYPEIDKRIKETYIKYSTAQKTKAYDMYVRFIRWASDRLDKNGVIVFVSNNSFVKKDSFDGFRKIVAKEFNEIYVIDLKGDARTSGEQRRKEGGNVFSDQIRVGVAVYFLLRKEGTKGCHIHYTAIADYTIAEAKKDYLAENKISDLKFQPIQPDKQSNWLNLAENDWKEHIPVATKAGKNEGSQEPKSIFKLFSLGVVTARDEWVYDDSLENLQKKVRFLIDIYNSEVQKQINRYEPSKVADNLDYSIKWTRAVKRDLVNGEIYTFQKKHIVSGLYRPFISRYLYFASELNEMQYRLPEIFIKNNLVIGFTDSGSQKPFMVMVSQDIPDYHMVGAACGTQCLPLYRYLNNSEQMDNITDWALTQFQKHYRKEKAKGEISKQDIFHYVYSVLHHPAYRKKYEMNLKREFPRIPFYENFWQWAEWGKQLMDLHLNYEQVEPYPLERVDMDPETTRKAVVPRLLARKESGVIEVDTLTTLSGVPNEASEYRLGTYTALEWVLERYKEKTPKDPTIREKFNTYRFKDYKEHVIDLLGRVCRVSVETMRIVREMREN